MKPLSINLKEEKNNEQKAFELALESNFLNLFSHFTEFITAIAVRQIEQKLKEKEEAEQEYKAPVFYTIKEVAEMLKITKTSLYIYTHKKKLIKFQKIGNRVLFARQDVLNALTSFKKYERTSL